jgi:hypothetical protein
MSMYAYKPPFIFLAWRSINDMKNLTFIFYWQHKTMGMEANCLPASGTVWASDFGGWGAVENM